MHLRGQLRFRLPLPPSDESPECVPGPGTLKAHGLQLLIHALRYAAEGQPAVSQFIIFFIRRAPECKVHRKLRAVKRDPFSFTCDRCLRQAGRSIVLPFHFSGFRGKYRPVSFPDHRADKSLPAEILVFTFDEAGGQHDRVPAAVRKLHQVCMPDIDDRGMEAHMAMR